MEYLCPFHFSSRLWRCHTNTTAHSNSLFIKPNFICTRHFASTKENFQLHNERWKPLNRSSARRFVSISGRTDKWSVFPFDIDLFCVLGEARQQHTSHLNKLCFIHISNLCLMKIGSVFLVALRRFFFTGVFLRWFALKSFLNKSMDTPNRRESSSLHRDWKERMRTVLIDWLSPSRPHRLDRLSQWNDQRKSNLFNW